jgi:murein DD-endopeptidase MepM/ murein hydrolase activator NlpD
VDGSRATRPPPSATTRERSRLNELNALATLDSKARRAADALAQRPRLLVAAISTALAGFAAAAFAIAPLAPDAASLPKRWISESVHGESIERQLEALSEHSVDLYRSDTTHPNDTVDTLLARLGADDPAAATFLRSDAVARKVLEGRPGKMVQARVDRSGLLQELIARYPAQRAEQAATHFTRLRITRPAGVLLADMESAPLATQVRLGSGTIRATLYSAIDEARIPDGIADQMAEMFSTDIDFHRELRKGDTFTVVYESLTADGEPITWDQDAGRVLAARFINGGRSYSAVWFRNSSGKGSYFGLDGKSKHRTFLASPMEFSRVTSGFSNRLHPILQTWRAHLGVDYAAPTGTQVRTVGEGVVEFAGWQSGYGNVVQIDHGQERSTTYAHLSRIDVTKGQQVEQGQRIGTVGSTGWATGPHLHFEFRVNGQHKDPLTLAKNADDVTLDPDDKLTFAELAGSLRAQLEAAESNTRLGLAE